MPWFKVDDHFAIHAKAVAAGNPAIGLWVRAGSWSAGQLSDGHVPAAMLPVLGGRPADARRLVSVGLWHDHGHVCEICPQPQPGAFVFHAWRLFQPVKEEVERKRAEARDRMARNRSGSKDVRANSEGTSHAVTPTPTRPDPTRPDAAAAAAPGSGGSGGQLPPEVDVLRSKMSAFVALQALRWDTLTDEQTATIVALIHQHGDQRLVDVAVRTCRTPPPVMASAFLGTWSALDGPRLVADDRTLCNECQLPRAACARTYANHPDPDVRHDFQEAS